MNRRTTIVRSTKATFADNKYVRATDASLANVMKANEGKKAVSSWVLTVAYLNKVKALSSYDASKTEKSIAAELRKNFKSAFAKDYFALVVEGKARAIDSSTRGLNARTGKIVSVIGRKGIKFASWVKTMESIKCVNLIAKVIKAGRVNDLIKGNEVLNKRDASEIIGTRASNYAAEAAVKGEGFEVTIKIA